MFRYSHYYCYRHSCCQYCRYPIDHHHYSFVSLLLSLAPLPRTDGTLAGDLPGDVALQKELGVALLLLTAPLRAQLLLRDVEH